MKPRTLLILLLTAGIAYFLYVSGSREGLKAGSPAPGFALPSRNGVVTLDQFRGKVVLINFWATWCPPCVQEMPSLENLKKRMEGKAFQILAVSVDEEGWKPIERFVEKMPLSLPILLDLRGDVADLYGTSRLPESYLIDKNGTVVKKYLGPRDWTEPKIVAEITRYVEGS
jgi:peroxiredoxin